MAEEGTMVEAGEDTTAVGIMEAMVMEATTGIPIMAFTSAHRFILILITVFLINTPITIRQQW